MRKTIPAFPTTRRVDSIPAYKQNELILYNEDKCPRDVPAFPKWMNGFLELISTGDYNPDKSFFFISLFDLILKDFFKFFS